MKITVSKILHRFEGPCRIIIREGKKNLYVGYAGMLEYEDNAPLLKRMLVEQIGIHTELRHKDWQKMGYEAPLEPEEVPDISYSDLREMIYVVLTVKAEE